MWAVTYDEDFYGFSERPFNFGPDPRFLYLAPSHREVFYGMLSGAIERKGITVITGDPGVGKTTLIRALNSAMDEQVRTAFVVFTLLNFVDLLRNILYQFGVPTGREDTSALLDKIYDCLLEMQEDDTISIVIDEADGLEMNALKELMRLWARPNLSAQLQIILVGQPELEAKLDSRELRSLREKITVRRLIRPLSPQESNAYVDHRLRIVGSSSSEIFKPVALEMVCDCAEGNPRSINMICDECLRIGYTKLRRKIDTVIVSEAAQGMGLVKEQSKKMLAVRRRRAEESTIQPCSAQKPWRRPARPVALGSLLAMVALALFAVLTSGDVPPKETKVKDAGSVIVEQSSAFSTSGEQNRRFSQIKQASARGEPRLKLRKQKKAANCIASFLDSEDEDARALKQDEAWRVLWR